MGFIPLNITIEISLDQFSRLTRISMFVKFYRIICVFFFLFHRIDKCHWKEILKRLKKPEISIRVEGNEKQTASSTEDSAEAEDRKSAEVVTRKNSGENAKSYTLENYYSSSEISGGVNQVTKNDASSWYSDSQSSTTYYMDADGDDMDDEDDAMLKYEYESSRNAILANNSSSHSGASASSLAVASAAVASNAQHVEHAKPLDKSSVRRYCVQVAEHLFQCTLCYKTYTHISNFSRHFLSAHHGLRQEIPCPVCYRIFTRRDNMLTHMKQVHRITVTRGLATGIVQKRSAANETDSQINSN